jgi:hypothetical protein
MLQIMSNESLLKIWNLVIGAYLDL